MYIRGLGFLDNVAAAFNYDRESLGRSGSFRRANEQTLIKLISEGQVSLPLSLSLSLPPSLRLICTPPPPPPPPNSYSQVAQQDLQYLEILGHGSGGTVYRTFHQMSKIIMAVKVLALDATPEEQKQIKSELEILHKVTHTLSLSLSFLSLTILNISTV